MRSEKKDQTLWALLDQAAVSGGNFLTSLILARSLSRTDFGTYSLLLLTLLSINTLHNALVAYPLTLAVAGDVDKDGGHQAVGRALAHTLVLSFVWMWLLITVLTILHRLDAFPAMLMAMVAWHLQEVARCAFVANADIRGTILPDTLSYLGQAGILLVLRPSGMSEIFLCIGATSVAALAWQLTLSRPHFLRPFKSEVVQSAWKLGKFALVGNIVGMGILQLPSWAIDVFHGRATVGSYQALANLVGLANPVIFSMGALLTPAVVRASLIGRDHARRSALRHGLRFSLFLLPAFLLLAMAPHHVMLLVYGHNSPYLALAPFLRVFSVTLVLQFIGSVIGGYEGGVARPRSYMYSQFSCLGVLATVGLLLIYFYGIAGAVYASLIAAAARMLGFLYVSIRSDRSHKALAASLQEVQ